MCDWLPGLVPELPCVVAYAGHPRCQQGTKDLEYPGAGIPCC